MWESLFLSSRRERVVAAASLRLAPPKKKTNKTEENPIAL
jgi:hypothetical protein